MSDPHAAGKRAAARAAVDALDSGVRLGLGTGSTVEFALQRIAERIDEERFDVVGVPTSEATAARAARLGILLASLDEIDSLDVTIDGADEVDPHFALIKGGGGALLREKIVAAAAARLWIVVGENKLVPHLGATFALPVEILPFGALQTARRIAACGVDPVLRTRDGGRAFVTDNGNHIVDCRLPAHGIDDLAGFASRLSAIPGVVEHGLFLDMTERVFVGAADGTARVLRAR